MEIFNQSFEIPESLRGDFLVPGLSLQNGDRIVLSTSGTIWAGVWFTGSNDADGWTNYRAGNHFPLPNAPQFGLIAKIGSEPYFFAGRQFERIYRGAGGTLALRINDDAPSNGNGAFTVRVMVFRESSSVVFSDRVVVKERDRDVAAFANMQHNDRIIANASGFIWAGVWFTGENGPEGWINWPMNKPNAPLNGVNQYSLLFKVGSEPYNFLGRSINTQYSGGGGQLFFRINDDAPDNGSGEFVVDYQILRTVPEQRIPFAASIEVEVEGMGFFRNDHVPGELLVSYDLNFASIIIPGEHRLGEITFKLLPGGIAGRLAADNHITGYTPMIKLKRGVIELDVNDAVFTTQISSNGFFTRTGARVSGASDPSPFTGTLVTTTQVDVPFLGLKNAAIQCVLTLERGIER